MSKPFILDLQKSDWEAWAKENAFPKFRAAQIYEWTSKGIIALERMKNVPKNILEKMNEDFIIEGMKIERTLVSKKDGTRKYVFLLQDGNRIETVLMKYKTGYSLCISSQSGCRMGCVFCASSYVPFGRNLTAGEMLGQITLVSEDIKERIRSVVVMGLGEAFDNYQNFLLFLKLANDTDGLNLGARHITVSTCGLVPQMLEFMSIDMQVNMAISLHAARNDLREKIMPIAKKYDIDSLLLACREYEKKTKRRITFEYSLFHQVNDSVEEARLLVKKLRGIHCHVNLIAANEFPGSPVKRSSPEAVLQFQKILEQSGIPVTLRREMGTDIMAACGQLRRGIEVKAKLCDT